MLLERDREGGREEEKKMSIPALVSHQCFPYTLTLIFPTLHLTAFAHSSSMLATWLHISFRVSSRVVRITSVPSHNPAPIIYWIMQKVAIISANCFFYAPSLIDLL